jgi:hypothetical protein
MGGVFLMAVGGHAVLDIVTGQFINELELTIRKVERGTKKATLAAIKEIYEESQMQVPKDTGTLARSGYYHVTGGYRTEFVGTVGYGKPGVVNPKSGQEADGYMVQVHEDLSVHHKNGKAKFLEDPIKNYQKRALGKYSTFIKNELHL